MRYLTAGRGKSVMKKNAQGGSMRSITVLVLAVLIALSVVGNGSAQARLNETLTVPRHCLGETRSIMEAVDWNFMAEDRSPTRPSLTKTDYLGMDWELKISKLGPDGYATILTGKSAGPKVSPTKSVFGVLLAVKRNEYMVNRYVTLFYQPILASCSTERLAIIEHLEKNELYRWPD